MRISERQRQFANIYPNKNRSIDYLMVHLSTKCSEIARIFNHQKHHFLQTDPHVLEALAWICAIATYFEIELESALVARFPGVCSYCLSSPCTCSETNKHAFDRRLDRELSAEEVEKELKNYRNVQINRHRPVDFDELRAQIFAIYPSNRFFAYSGYYAFLIGKVDEEKGEVHKAYSAFLLGRGSKEDIATEIGDLVAWLISLWDVKNNRRSIDAELSNLYRHGFPTCKSTPCACPDYSISQGEEELVRLIVRQLKELQSAGVVDAKQVEEAVSLAAETKEGTRPAAKSRFFTLVSSVSEAAKKAPNASDGVMKTVQNLNSTFDLLKGLFN